MRIMVFGEREKYSFRERERERERERRRNKFIRWAKENDILLYCWQDKAIFFRHARRS